MGFLHRDVWTLPTVEPLRHGAAVGGDAGGYVPFGPHRYPIGLGATIYLSEIAHQGSRRYEASSGGPCWSTIFMLGFFA